MTDLSVSGSSKRSAKVLKNPSVLAFERKVDPSDAVFSDGSGALVAVREKSIRGTISNRLSKKDQGDTAKLDAKISNANVQTVDVVVLPPSGPGSDVLKVDFTLRILGGVGVPSSCNDSAYRARLAEVVQSYRKSGGFDRLGLLYAWNIANARYLWRNRPNASEITVSVTPVFGAGSQNQTLVFDAFDFSLNSLDGVAENESLVALGKMIADVLSGDGVLLLKVSASAVIGSGQEVFPSQEMAIGSDSDKSKVLFSIETEDGPAAGFHSQKIGNALRTIDFAYGDGKGRPIAVEPYGSVTTEGAAYRAPSAGKRDFYNLLDNWVLRGKEPENPEDKHFVMAVLVRGGVFGESSK